VTTSHSAPEALAPANNLSIKNLVNPLSPLWLEFIASIFITTPKKLLLIVLPPNVTVEKGLLRRLTGAKWEVFARIYRPKLSRQFQRLSLAADGGRGQKPASRKLPEQLKLIIKRDPYPL
jgi:hypothetical protein